MGRAVRRSRVPLFESWLDRISSWADHDGRLHYLIAPMVAANPARVKDVFRWGKVRAIAASAGSLRGPDPRSAGENAFPADRDALRFPASPIRTIWLQKGLGWLLRETAKFDAQRTVPYLMKFADALRGLYCARRAKPFQPE